MNSSFIRPFRTLAVVLVALLATHSMAHSYRAGDIEVGHPWARPTVPGQRAGGAFLSLTNRGTSPDKLLSAASPVAATVELHTMTLEGNVMRMREVGAIDIPAGQNVKLQPGGLHIMFMGLKAPLKLGESVPMTLRFEKAGEVTVEVKVEMPQAENGAPAPGAHGDHKHQ
ncbi:MAG: copper chaperone PCu(A)C [Pseudomonadota bacterium]